jgi:hypothetical protein
MSVVASGGSRRWWAHGAVCLGVLAVGVDGTVLSVGPTTLSKALNASESDLQCGSPPLLPRDGRPPGADAEETVLRPAVITS